MLFFSLISNLCMKQIKELALDYNNCAFSPRIARLVQEIQRQRYIMETSRLAFEKKCSIHERERHCLANNTSVCGNSPVVPADANSVEKIMCDSSITLPHPTTFIRQFQGLGCRTNRSLNFFIIDSDQYPNFQFKLGYSLKHIRQNSNSVFIIDPTVINYIIFPIYCVTKS